MLKFITSLFAKKPAAPKAETPYKVEAPAAPAKKAVKKPSVKKASTRKPKAPKA